MKADQYIAQWLALRSQIHVYHRQTRSFAEHKALDGFYNEIVEQLDDFVETYQGRFGRVQFNNPNESLKNYEKGAAAQALQQFVASTQEMKKELGEEPSDLQNILDEIVGLTQKTLYLLSLE